MRRVVLSNRPCKSIVQQTGVVNTRSLIRSLAKGETIDLNIDASMNTFDYDLSEEVDFGKRLVEDPPSKIAQYLNPDKYLSPASAENEVEHTPPDEE